MHLQSGTGREENETVLNVKKYKVGIPLQNASTATTYMYFWKPKLNITCFTIFCNCKYLAGLWFGTYKNWTVYTNNFDRFIMKFTISFMVSLEKNMSFLWLLTNSKTLPLDMNGITSRGISPSRHTPIRDITWGCSKDNIVDTSFASLSKSLLENRTAGWTKDKHLPPTMQWPTFSSFNSNQFFT